MRWQTAWLLIRDVLATGTGLALIISQVFAKSPNVQILLTGLTLTTPSLLSHTTTLLGGPGPSESSSSSSPHGPPLPSSREGSGEAGD